MVKIDFTKLPCYVDIQKKAKIAMDVRYNFSNMLYIYGKGIEMGALAMKIYNSHGEESFSQQECDIILKFAHSSLFSPLFGDSVEECIGAQRKTS